MTTIASYRRLTASLPAALDRIATQPQVKREIDYYSKKIGSVKSLDAFMSDDRLYRFAVTAFGLQEMSYAKAFIRRVLSEGIDRRDAMANKLTDPRYRELAETLNFKRYGTATTSFDRATKGVVEKYVRQALEVEAGTESEGLRLALYFQRKAPNVTSAYGLMADRALLKVTQIAVGLPESASAIDLDKQAVLIEKGINVADLKKPEKLDKLLTRFAALWDLQSPQAPATTNAGLIAPQTASAIAPETLSLLQALNSRR